MITGDWPDEAREAAITALVVEWSETGVSPTREQMAPAADAVLAALKAHAHPHGGAWEWGVRIDVDWISHRKSEEDARFAPSGAVVRRRPAGEWELAP